MNTPVTHRFVALVLSVVLTLGLFETVSGFAAPEYTSQLLVRTELLSVQRG